MALLFFQITLCNSFFIQKRKVTNNKKLEDSPEREEITQIDPTQSVDTTKIEKKKNQLLLFKL